MTDPNLAAKREAAVRAVDLVESGMIVGLGTGSTATLAVDEIARRLGSGDLRDITGIPTSKSTEQHAVLSGIPLTTLEDHPVVHLTIDGADEVDPNGNLIKGLGGALLREKIVATATEKLVIVVDPTKLVGRLGTRAPLPVEVVSFGAGAHGGVLRTLGAEASLRLTPEGDPFLSDEGHNILDCRFAGGIDEPAVVEQTLHARPGIVETGLFLGMHPEVIIGTPSAS